MSFGCGQALLTKCQEVFTFRVGSQHLAAAASTVMGCQGCMDAQILAKPGEGTREIVKTQKDSSSLWNQTLINYHSKHEKKTLFKGTDV